MLFAVDGVLGFIPFKGYCFHNYIIHTKYVFVKTLMMAGRSADSGVIRRVFAFQFGIF